MIEADGRLPEQTVNENQEDNARDELLIAIEQERARREYRRSHGQGLIGYLPVDVEATFHYPHDYDLHF